MLGESPVSKESGERTSLLLNKEPLLLCVVVQLKELVATALYPSGDEWQGAFLRG